MVGLDLRGLALACLLGFSRNAISKKKVAYAALSFVPGFDLWLTFPNIDRYHTYLCSQMCFGMG